MTSRRRFFHRRGGVVGLFFFCSPAPYRRRRVASIWIPSAPIIRKRRRYRPRSASFLVARPLDRLPSSSSASVTEFLPSFFCVWLDSCGQTVVDDTFLLRPELVLILFAFFTGSFFLDLRPASIASASAAAGHPAGSTSSFYWSASWCSPRSSKTASGQQRL